MTLPGETPHPCIGWRYFLATSLDLFCKYIFLSIYSVMLCYHLQCSSTLISLLRFAPWCIHRVIRLTSEQKTDIAVKEIEHSKKQMARRKATSEAKVEMELVRYLLCVGGVWRLRCYWLVSKQAAWGGECKITVYQKIQCTGNAAAGQHQLLTWWWIRSESLVKFSETEIVGKTKFWSCNDILMLQPQYTTF